MLYQAEPRPDRRVGILSEIAAGHNQVLIRATEVSERAAGRLLGHFFVINYSMTRLPDYSILRRLHRELLDGLQRMVGGQVGVQGRD